MAETRIKQLKINRLNEVLLSTAFGKLCCSLLAGIRLVARINSLNVSNPSKKGSRFVPYSPLLKDYSSCNPFFILFNFTFKGLVLKFL